MKRYLFSLIIFAILVGNPEKALGQSYGVKTLSGYWKMRNTTESIMKIVPSTGCSFKASFLENGLKKEFSGILYEETYLSIVEETNNPLKMVYTGRLNEEGQIYGKSYSPECRYGDFIWVKICDEYGSPLAVEGEEFVPCGVPSFSEATPRITQTRGMTPTTMVTQKQTQQVVERTEYVGEPRNENIPLAETVSEVPPGAIYTGNIGLAEKVIYRTVEVEVPLALEPQVCEPLQETSTRGGSSFSFCDPGSLNPVAFRSVPTPGKEIRENGITYHIVGKQETMYTISRRYKLSIEALAALNGKDCEHLIEGERLRVSQ